MTNEPTVTADDLALAEALCPTRRSSDYYEQCIRDMWIEKHAPIIASHREKPKPKVLVIVRGGCVQDVLTADGGVEHDVLDYDVFEYGDGQVHLDDWARALLSDEVRAELDRLNELNAESE